VSPDLFASADALEASFRQADALPAAATRAAAAALRAGRPSAVLARAFRAERLRRLAALAAAAVDARRLFRLDAAGSGGRGAYTARARGAVEPTPPPPTARARAHGVGVGGLLRLPPPPACAAAVGEPRAIVIDGPNVAMLHGKQLAFSCRGIELALRYWEARGHVAVAIVPAYHLDYAQVAGRRRLATAGRDVAAAKLPDDIALLERLAAAGRLVPTPAHDYDDAYALQYARLHDGYILSNDRYADYADKCAAAGARRRDVTGWLRAHVISFAWFGDELLPSPEFVLLPKPPGAASAVEGAAAGAGPLLPVGW
jgi:hypothetical protein